MPPTPHPQIVLGSGLGRAPGDPSPAAVARTSLGERPSLKPWPGREGENSRLKIRPPGWLAAPSPSPLTASQPGQLPAVSAYLKPGRLVAWIPVLLISSWVLLEQAELPHPQPAGRGIPRLC